MAATLRNLVAGLGLLAGSSLAHAAEPAAPLRLLSQGDVIGIARIAAIQAAKKTSDLIPLCHPLALTHVDIEFTINRKAVAVDCIATVETRGRTGVEMEALTAVAAALLTIYDMCKAVDRGMQLENIALQEKRGGKSGVWIKKIT